MADFMDKMAQSSYRLKASLQVVFDTYRIFIQGLSESGDYQLKDPARFYLGLDFLETVSWKIRRLGRDLNAESVKFRDWAAQNAPAVSGTMDSQDGVMESLELINDWWERQFERGFDKDRRQEVFDDAYYHRRGGGPAPRKVARLKG